MGDDQFVARLRELARHDQDEARDNATRRVLNRWLAVVVFVGVLLVSTVFPLVLLLLPRRQ